MKTVNFWLWNLWFPFPPSKKKAKTDPPDGPGLPDCLKRKRKKRSENCELWTVSHSFWTGATLDTADYAQTLIVVVLIVVNIFGFSKITRYHGVLEVWELVEIISTDLPDLSKPIFLRSNRGKTKNVRQFFRVNPPTPHDY